MLFIHHLITAIAAILGVLVGAFLLKYKKNKRALFVFWFLIFFGIGQFIHVLVFDAIIYDKLKPVPPEGVIYEGNETAFEYHVIQGLPWRSCSIEDVIEKMTWLSYNGFGLLKR
jgi:ABC-type microcin C transport system permease subunit YejE